MIFTLNAKQLIFFLLLWITDSRICFSSNEYNSFFTQVFSIQLITQQSENDTTTFYFFVFYFFVIFPFYSTEIIVKTETICRRHKQISCYFTHFIVLQQFFFCFIQFNCLCLVCLVSDIFEKSKKKQKNPT